MTSAALGRGFPAHWSAHFSGKGWTGLLGPLGLAWLAILLVFARDVADMATIWWTSSTFSHCLFIPLIAGWLVALRRDELHAVAPQPWLPGVAFVLGSALLWTIGEAAGLGLFRHAAIVLMLQSLVLTILGLNATRALLFPLFYLSFMVPAGEELVPLLQTVTAQMSMAMLGLAGIPAHINGVFITIPNGYFEVAEACSGVKFLIAMVAFGALAAHLCFKTWTRRALFMLACVIIPVLANGVRAFATIYVADLKGVQAAAGFDHVVYGWFFFAVVMALIMALAWPFFDRASDAKALDGFKAMTVARKANCRLVLGWSFLALAAPIGWQMAASAAGRIEMPSKISLPTVRGWSQTEAVGTPWSPHYAGADHQLLGHYQNAAGDQVDLAIVLFAWQDEGREVIGFGQGAASPDGPWTWTASANAPEKGKAERIVARGPVDREVLTYYVTSRGQTGSAHDVKFNTIIQRLFGGDQAVAAVLVSAQDRPDRPARASLDRFVADLGSPDDLATRLIREARAR